MHSDTHTPPPVDMLVLVAYCCPLLCAHYIFLKKIPILLNTCLHACLCACCPEAGLDASKGVVETQLKKVILEHFHGSEVNLNDTVDGYFCTAACAATSWTVSGCGIWCATATLVTCNWGNPAAAFSAKTGGMCHYCAKAGAYFYYCLVLLPFGCLKCCYECCECCGAPKGACECVDDCLPSCDNISDTGFACCESESPDDDGASGEEAGRLEGAHQQCEQSCNPCSDDYPETEMLMAERCGGFGNAFVKHIPILNMLIAIGICVSIYGITTDFYFYTSMPPSDQSTGIGRAQLVFSVIGVLLFLAAILFGLKETDWSVLQALAWDETWESHSKLLLQAEGAGEIDDKAISTFRKNFKANLVSRRADDLGKSAGISFKLAVGALLAADIPQLVILGEFKKKGSVDDTALILAIVGCILSIVATALSILLRIARCGTECCQNCCQGSDSPCCDCASLCCPRNGDEKGESAVTIEVRRIVSKQPTRVQSEESFEGFGADS